MFFQLKENITKAKRYQVDTYILKKKKEHKLCVITCYANKAHK